MESEFVYMDAGQFHGRRVMDLPTRYLRFVRDKWPSQLIRSEAARELRARQRARVKRHHQ